ncbi:MAG: AEC family transporter [Dehalobacter sp. 4CP]|uniref:AEC family transporter n=1 Tax=Dehalobacter sp. CP TaxID=2594474 RepID=UPI0013C671CB|nr:AEC family transporter [Dehalobacter sp. 4CP]
MELQGVYNQLGILFLTILLGYVLAKVKVIPPAATQVFSKFVLTIALPALILSGMRVSFTTERLHTALFVFLLTIPCYGLAFLVGKLTAKILTKNRTREAIFNFGIVFANTGFLGFPIFQALYGKEAIFYAAIYNIMFNLLLYTLGIKIMNTDKTGHPTRLNLKKVINPGVGASIIGFILFITAVPLPEFMTGTIDAIGNTCVPLSMLTIGATLSELPLQRMFSDIGIYILSVVRLLVMPLLTLVLVKYIFQIDQMWLIAIPVIMAGMPIATNTVLMAIEYKNDARLASQTVLISTLLSCLSIPLLILVLSHF